MYDIVSEQSLFPTEINARSPRSLKIWRYMDECLRSGVESAPVTGLILAMDRMLRKNYCKGTFLVRTSYSSLLSDVELDTLLLRFDTRSNKLIRSSYSISDSVAIVQRELPNFKLRFSNNVVNLHELTVQSCLFINDF